MIYQERQSSMDFWCSMFQSLRNAVNFNTTQGDHVMVSLPFVRRGSRIRCANMSINVKSRSQNHLAAALQETTDPVNATQGAPVVTDLNLDLQCQAR
jgi:hypothetical protein